MTPRINPHLLTAGHLARKRAFSQPQKTFRAAFTMRGMVLVARRICGTAPDAQRYADTLLARWIRLYDAAMAAGEPNA